MCNTVFADRLPYRCICVGERVAHNVAAECEVRVEFEKMGLDLLEVEGFEGLCAGLPFGDCGVHGDGFVFPTVSPSTANLMYELELGKVVRGMSGMAGHELVLAGTTKAMTPHIRVSKKSKRKSKGP